MKITKLEIKDFHQFKNFELDLTYPEGHAKQGQPLEKVCIIGQSGTGKTTLLELLGGLARNIKAVIKKYNLKYEHAIISIIDNDIFYEQRISRDAANYTVNNFSHNNEKLEFDDFKVLYTQYINERKPILMYFPAELKFDLSDEVTEENSNIESSDKEEIEIEKKSIYDFSLENALETWKITTNEIKHYHEEELIIRQEISKIAENASSNINAIQEAVKKLEEWKSKVFNPVKNIADNYLNPILKKFNLKVRTDLDIRKQSDIGSLKIEDFQNNLIPSALLSTGTKQILYNSIPLHQLKPNQTLIFFDEPERSLYPDLQRDIVSYYQSLTTDCQLFFATHSPIIASSFEPWEIVELKFNREEGYVYQEKYYDEEKGRHIDNYFIDPNFLTIDLILSKVFDLTETHSPVRNEQIAEALMLRGMLEKIKGEKKNNTKKFKDLYEKYQNIATKLAWDFDIPTYAENQ